MSEIWRDIKGYEGLYQVSSKGEVQRLETTITRRCKDILVTQRVKATRLKLAYNIKSGYPTVTLCKNGKTKTQTVHVLVALAFLGNVPEGKIHVCHEDGNVINCDYTNLRYDTPKGNALDRYKHGTDAKGEHNPRAKYSEQQILQIKKLLLLKTQKEISIMLNIPYSTIRTIKQGKRWGWLDIKAEMAV